MNRTQSLSARGFQVAIVAVLIGALSVVQIRAGLSRELQDYYTQQYKNRALYLKIPVHGFRQVVRVGPQPEIDRTTLGQPLAFRVGEQVRILELNFKNDFIRFKIGAVDLSRQSEIVFEFPAPITEGFPQGGAFDAALDFTFTAGANYREIDAAKETFIADQFDRLIDQFAATTGTSRQHVIQTISEKNPEFEKNKRLLQQRERELSDIRQQLEVEAAARRAAEREMGSLQRRLSDAETAADSLKGERMELLDERDDLRERLQALESDQREWQKKTREYESRIADLARSLDVESSSNAELGSRVTTLGEAIEQLKQSNTELSEQLDELRQEHREQTAELERTESERKRLAADLRALTSDKKSINSRYLEERKQAEALGTALELAAGLTVQRKGGAGPDQGEIYLLGRKLGSLTVQQPSVEPFNVRLEMVSPDTVEFTEEERRVWSVLEAQPMVRLEWLSADPDLKPQLVNSEAERKLAPREPAQWTYQLAAAPSRPTPLRLRAILLDSEGREVPAFALDYTAQPGGFRSLIAGVSWLWLFLGLVIGAAAVTLVKLGRGRASPGSSANSRREAPAKRL